ncbi:uncharacterized protein LOC129869714 [Solanum dulcamara]|uniref:uncharacterized protein LOC129869714 n=1 Tax=Solanum dulcamara TaxID=45834 RepID=UPI002486C016|nr:uncharacterized protein LOC129869714 [Solanum dulcamara]
MDFMMGLPRTSRANDELGPHSTDLLQDAFAKVRAIQDRLRTTQSRHQSYADRRRRPLRYEVGDQVFLRVSPLKGIMRFGRHAFLGKLVSKDDIMVDPVKIEAIRDWARPTSTTDIRSFIGLVDYYKCIIEGFSTIVTSLTRLSRQSDLSQ